MKKTALLLIDFQNDYFESFHLAKWPLKNTEQAAQQAAKLLSYFRKNNSPVIQVKHEALTNNAPFFHAGSTGADIHHSVKPTENETVILKHKANSFLDTNLQEALNKNHIQDLVIAGAMSHMCIDATTRAAADLNYSCTVIHDACATRDLAFKNCTIPADQVHNAFMAALEFAYAKVLSTEKFLTY